MCFLRVYLPAIKLLIAIPIEYSVYLPFLIRPNCPQAEILYNLDC